ncbi:hypothetical protein PP740_gp090 [Stenotrophomonas phage Philippe]|uniref:Uncharacterized protein n=1 Tax=Stenotrophomonas phage Philippe TaxID=2859655 RepID=A0AAE7WMV3_9CAUD|nr:hypothetical protein PP740_gp090 [Stenotrophomonas phage Philippe]QYW02252.1 hypothetical protein CPT_Philippe_059 [Stenotrophomonas phage Philippe]
MSKEFPAIPQKWIRNNGVHQDSLEITDEGGRTICTVSEGHANAALNADTIAATPLMFNAMADALEFGTFDANVFRNILNRASGKA